MKFRLKVVLFIALVLLTISGPASAALLGIELQLPVIRSDSPGTYSYNSSTNLLVSTGYSVWLFDGITQTDFNPRGTYSAAFYVNEFGNFAGGVLGDDLVITDGSGTVLVAGEVTDFGWDNSQDVNGDGTADFLFDFAFTFTHGSLASAFAQFNNHGGDVSRNTITSFSGDWRQDHSGVRVKSDVAPVSEPGTLLLLGSGLLGIALYMRRKQA